MRDNIVINYLRSLNHEESNVPILVEALAMAFNGLDMDMAIVASEETQEELKGYLLTTVESEIDSIYKELKEKQNGNK